MLSTHFRLASLEVVDETAAEQFSCRTFRACGLVHLYDGHLRLGIWLRFRLRFDLLAIFRSPLEMAFDIRISDIPLSVHKQGVTERELGERETGPRIRGERIRRYGRSQTARFQLVED